MAKDYSISRKAVNIYIGDLLSAVCRNKVFNTTTASIKFKKWFDSHDQNERVMIAQLATESVTNVERRIRWLRSYFKDDVFFRET